MKKGFTLIEVVVAVGLLAMVIGFSSLIFKVSIETRRTAGANAEIMQKLRAITNQLNRDFTGIRPDAPLLIWFDANNPDYRYDQIMFFADGDFQSTQLYSGTPVIGNVARIYYGQASVYSPTYGFYICPWDQPYPFDQSGDNYSDKMLNTRERMLARRTHILTADSSLKQFPLEGANFSASFTPTGNDSNEYDTNSLSQWKVITSTQANNDKIIATCFDNTSGRPQIDFVSQPLVGLHMLMTEGVGSFAVQWAYSCTASGGNTEYRWWPADNPDGDAATVDSDFGNLMGMGKLRFGIYFNMSGGVTVANTPDWSGSDQAKTENATPFAGFFPRALKFTFRIYDSKGIIKGGRTFTHIVYLEK
ncbi:MAG: prepilin-type N-terminal cleavage/methylation domain-containing protein [Planctomycetota bacterium]|nr:prepilin-type N-terminal cleavage/methylation domain-containing protein [Planctomycetota bacterium]